MATNQIAVLGQFQACALEAHVLDENCVPADSPNNVIVTTAIASGTLTPEIKEGTEIEAATACGDLSWVARADDKIKYWNLDLEMTLWDYEFLSVLIGGTLIIGDSTVSAWNGKVIGWAAPGFSTPETNGVALNIYSKVAFESGECPTGAVANPPSYIRHIMPKVRGQLQDRPFTEGDAAFVKLSLKCFANPRYWVDVEELSEWNTSTVIPQDSAYVQVFATTLPTMGAIDGGFQDVDITPGS